jgi:hypothetical protein
MSKDARGKLEQATRGTRTVSGSEFSATGWIGI